MTLVRLNALFRHWEDHPRIEWLVAGYMGIKPKNKGKKGFKDMKQNMREFMNMYGKSAKG